MGKIGLSLDGGGVRGIFQAHVLKRLEDEHELVEKFDVIGGTSTGAVVGACPYA